MSNPSLSRTLSLMVLSAALLGMGAAQAAEDPAKAVGVETRGWVDLQTEGAAASAVERPLPGEIADKTYQRYVESFAKPIPDQLSRDSFISGGGGSGGSGGSSK